MRFLVPGHDLLIFSNSIFRLINNRNSAFTHDNDFYSKIVILFERGLCTVYPCLNLAFTLLYLCIKQIVMKS